MTLMDIFSRPNRARKGGSKDQFDELIDIIEKFAPKEHLSKREAFYYNYRTMAQYKGPLLALLKRVSRMSDFKTDQEAHGREIFLRLKTFYDVKDRLSIAEAVEDTSLGRRYRELFLFFYGKKGLSVEDTGAWLKSLRD